MPTSEPNLPPVPSSVRGRIDGTINLPTLLAIVGVLVGQGFLPDHGETGEAIDDLNDRMEEIEDQLADLSDKLDDCHRAAE